MSNEKLLQIFYTEASEILAELENDLVELEKSPKDAELINKIFRAAHTLKGGAGIVDIEEIAHFTHTMENVLERLRSKEVTVTKGLTTILLSSVDIINAMLDDIMDGNDINNKAEANKIAEKLKHYLGGKQITRKKKESATKEVNLSDDKNIFKITMSFRPDIFSTGTDPIMFLRELKALGEIIECVTEFDNLPLIDKIEIFEFYLSFKVVIKTDQDISKVQNIFIFVSDENDIKIEDITQSLLDGNDSLSEKNIGEFLIDTGVVDQSDINEAASKQKKIGEILVSNGKVSKDTVNDALKKQSTYKNLKKTSTIRVTTDKLDKLVNVVGEMVINVARVNQLVNTNGNRNQDLTSTVELLDMICRDIQEQVMRVRMLPIAGTFKKFQRVVRDIASGQGKEVELLMSGTETELDKNVIEQLEDPLKHLVRNSVDHGIEMPDEREATGKKKEGTIWLRAYQQEGCIFVEIEDDGGGIDKEAILKKALEKGVALPNKSYNDDEIYKFMFEPGFSTAKKVTEISGRGVGLDVVKKNIENLRCSVSVQSELGKGTKLRIKLPLTLAIIEGMNVQVGSEVLTIPLLSVLELIRPKASEVKSVEGSGEVIEIRGKYLPLVRLHNIFTFDTDKTDPTKALVVIVESTGSKFGILVDEVIGEQQAVIKSLDKNFKKVNGVSGATIMGDGKVSLIVDIHGLEKLAFGR